MSRRYTYTASFSVGGDTPTWEGEVEFSYLVTWGRPAQTYGPAENCYPADPDELDDIKVEKIDGKASDWSFFLTDAAMAEDMIERLTDDDRAQMLADAAEDDIADADDADERRAEERRDMDRIFGPVEGDD